MTFRSEHIATCQYFNITSNLQAHSEESYSVKVSVSASAVTDIKRSLVLDFYACCLAVLDLSKKKRKKEKAESKCDFTMQIHVSEKQSHDFKCLETEMHSDQLQIMSSESFTLG